jgi:alkylation response protein AidB-like acyl-CoA dehydrogenase
LPNFYRDNPDLSFQMRQVDWEAFVPALESGFRDPADTAPRSLAEAKETYEAVLDLAGKICAEVAAPAAAANDAEGAHLVDGRVVYAKGTQRALDALKEARLLAMGLPRRYGGWNLPTTVTTAVLEMVGRADPALHNIVGAQEFAYVVNEFGSEELKTRVLPRVAEGSVGVAMVLTEADAGSDLNGVQCRATLDPAGRWTLNGTKNFATNGGTDILIVLARSEPGSTDTKGLSLFVVERCPQVRILKLEEKMGIHASPTCQLAFEDAPAWLVGERGKGLHPYMLRLMFEARLSVASQSVGVAQAAYEEALRYARVRQQFKRPLIRFHPIAEKLVRMSLEIQAVRALLYYAAQKVDRRAALRPAGGEAFAAVDRQADVLTPLLKYWASEMANRVAYEAVQIHGGYGYIREYPVERLYRDARILPLYEGTSEIQVGGVIGPILAGGLAMILDELSSRIPEGPVKKTLAEGRALLEASIAALAARNDKHVTQLYARPVVDSATEVLGGLLLCAQGAQSEKKALAAATWASDILPRIRMRAEVLSACDPIVILQLDALLI